MKLLFNSFALLLLTIVVSSCETQSAISQSMLASVVQPSPSPEQPETEPKFIRDFFVDADRLTYNGSEVVKLEKRVKLEESPEMINVSYAVLKKKGKTLAKFDGVYSGVGNAIDFGLFPFLGVKLSN